MLLGVSAWAALVLPREMAAAERPSSEEVEAAYLFNFGRFVRWPESAGQGPVLICVAGQDAIEQTVSRLATGEQIQRRALAVRTLDRPEDAGGCSILFVGAGQGQRTDDFLAATEGKPILTVGDGPSFAARGGIIQFVEVEDHVRFLVNLNAASRNSLNFSSELLKVAVTVIGKPGGSR